MTMNRFLAACIAIVVASATPVVAQEMYLSVKKVLHVLRNGSLQEREDVVARIIEVKATTRSPQVAAAVGAELVRVNGIFSTSEIPLGTYHGLLVQACAQSPYTSVIEPLVGAIDSGNMATDALARFGSSAFEQVFRVATTSRDEAKISGAFDTLNKMLQRRTVDSPQRGRITELVRSRLDSVQPAIVWRATFDLAIQTGDADLRGRVAAIASGAVAPRIVGGDDKAAWVKTAAQKALGQTTPR